MRVWRSKWFVLTHVLALPLTFSLYLLQGDMVEYNQCQSMLRNLYELGIPGKNEEFTAYHILLLLHGRNRSGMSRCLASLLFHCVNNPLQI